uniref:AIG1-type G domain-containing protein n=1 Tax=Cyprinodon variegatus TaxID=28743 RepID=A0A3Q2CQV5_CYPVA
MFSKNVINNFHGGERNGKSSAGNIILGHNVFDTSRRTTQSEARQQEVLGRRLTVVDTPGWWWHYPREETPKLDQIEIQNSVHLCPPGPHVFLLVIPVRSNFSQHVLMPLTERVWRHCMVLFTRGEWLNVLPVENYIVREGKELQELLEKCGNRYHVLSFFNYDDPVQVKELFQTIINMVKQNKGCFTTEGKRKKFQFLPQQRKQRILTEEEWNRREQELMERMMKALAKEPEKPTRLTFFRESHGIPVGWQSVLVTIT